MIEDHEATERAMALLRKRRHEQIEAAQDVALKILRRKADTNCREVWNVMRRCNLIDETVPNHWLGAVFRDQRFAWTGKWVIPPLSNGTPIHAQRPVKTWCLR